MSIIDRLLAGLLGPNAPLELRPAPPPTSRKVAEHPCGECGGDLLPTRLWITLDPRGVVLPHAVKAHSCVDCGRAFVPPTLWDRLERKGIIDKCSLHRMRAAAPVASGEPLQEGARV